jgi:hypothetical protein
MAIKNKINTHMFVRVIDGTNLGLIWIKKFNNYKNLFKSEALKNYKKNNLNKAKLDIINKLAKSSHKKLIKITLSDQKLIGEKKNQDEQFKKNDLLKKNFLKKITKLPRTDLITNYKIPISLNPLIGYFLKKIGELQKQINYIYYSSKSFKKISQFKNKNIIILLQFQPEKSTSPMGGIFCDQLKLIKYIRKIIGYEYNLLVKEHPSQFSKSYCRYFEKNRSFSFYNKISSLRKTFLLPIYFDIFSLPKDTIYISVTGTVILEAALRGLPAICLGHKWYNPLSTIKSAKNYKELKTILKNIDNINQICSKRKSKEFFIDVITSIDNEASIGGAINSYPKNIEYYEKKGIDLYEVYLRCKVFND